jgi:hypothetical protein
MTNLLVDVVLDRPPRLGHPDAAVHVTAGLALVILGRRFAIVRVVVPSSAGRLIAAHQHAQSAPSRAVVVLHQQSLRSAGVRPVAELRHRCGKSAGVEHLHLGQAMQQVTPDS